MKALTTRLSCLSRQLPLWGSLVLFMCYHATNAQDTLRATISLYPDSIFQISPYIYGINYQADYHELNITSRRLGGTRMSTYNWETNASNAGTNWAHVSDDYFAHELGIDPFERKEPARVIRTFHDSSLSAGAYSLITVPMLGYVAADKYGSVSKNESAPSQRWLAVRNFHPGKIKDKPDLSDRSVYTDEFIHFLKQRYGKSTSPTGIRGYTLDNETELWSLLVPYARYKPVQCQELIDLSVNTAHAIKSVDKDAEIFGPSLYGFEAYRNLHSAYDWGWFYDRGYTNFIQAYLAGMKKAEDSLGLRLLDVLDVHWYPEATGTLAGDYKERIINHSIQERPLAEARMQAPRTLWDSTYSEDSYIAKYYSPFTLLPWLKKEINDYYPGTRLSVSEYEYGGSNDVSGGITQADVLGIWGTHGIYMANLWGTIDGYIASAFRLYRNYDGANSTFGSTGIKVTNTDPVNTSAYASQTVKKKKKTVHIILLNKNYDQYITFDIGTNIPNASKVRVFGFDSTTPNIHLIRNARLENSHSITLPPLSAYHLELSE